MTDPIHTLEDLLHAAAKALDARDADALQRLRRIPQDWLQTERETAAQAALLDAMAEAAFELAEADEQVAALAHR